MTIHFQRRHNRWHEQLLLSRGFLILTGWLFTVVGPYLLFWSWDALWQPDDGQRTAFIVTSLAYVFSHWIAIKLRAQYPGRRAAGFIAPTIFIVYGLFSLMTFMSYLAVSRSLLLGSGSSALFWMYFQYLMTYKHMRLKLAVIPGGEYTAEVLAQPVVHARPLEKLTLQGVRYDGVVADFESIDEPTQRFLAQCALNGIPVYDAKSIYESLAGRVKIHRMSENNIGSLLPSPFYEAIKRCMDIVAVLLMTPVALVIGGMVVALIKLESPGPVIFKQIRIGQGNRPFTIYKFRSMRFDRSMPAQFAGEIDPRITRVGRIIRKLRVDEFPQFINVLKGEMSLIGPRPEQPDFFAEYDEKIPFYSYRHIVKPGITGWAQVRHGYTASSDETKIKIEHDFYYIKNCSFSLDLIIMLLTVRIMLSGFGAR